jgi:hypothetical protein
MNISEIPPFDPGETRSLACSRSTSPVPPDPDAPPSHDPEYYLQDDMAIFLVSGIIVTRQFSLTML